MTGSAKVIAGVKHLWEVWKNVAHKIGNFQARVLLTIFYGVLVSPMGLIVRLFGDPHDFGFPKNAIQFCLDRAGLRGEDLDYVVFFEKPFRKFDRILMTVLQTYPQSWKVFRESMISWMLDKLWVGAKLKTDLGVPYGVPRYVDKVWKQSSLVRVDR